MKFAIVFFSITLYLVSMMKQFYFDSGLDEDTFAKTGLYSSIKENGLYAVSRTAYGQPLLFTFEPWSFSSIETKETGNARHVCFTGETFNGRFLSDVIGKKTFEAGYAVYALCAAVQQIIKENRTDVPCTGTGGILFKTDETEVEFLFLPAQIAEASAAHAGEDAHRNLQQYWKNPFLAGDKALCFTAAAFAYSALTGSLPFPKTDEAERNTEMHDKNFIRLEHVINGVDTNLADAVDNALSGRGSFIPLPELKKELGLNETFGTVVPVEHPDAVNPVQFEAQKKAYYAARTTGIKTLRTIKRNITGIISCAVAIVIIAVTALGIAQDNGDKPTSRGFTSAQTVQAFYKGIHTQDANLMGCVSKGDGVSHFIDAVSQVYVGGRIRNMKTESVLPPEKWILSSPDAQGADKLTVFGITHFMLDGENSFIGLNVPKRKDAPSPLKTESGMVLTDGCTAVHTAEYYFLYTGNESHNLEVLRYTDKVTVTYMKKRWLVTNVDSKAEPVPVDAQQFITDRRTLTIEELQQKYNWLPQ